MKTRLLAVLIFSLLSNFGFAQTRMTLLGVDSGQTTTATTAFGASIDFRVGRDNFAFPNLSGAVRTAGMSGNCYAMAACAKLFHERARFEAGEGGFEVAALATHLSSGSGRFAIRGYSSLFDMTNDAKFGEADAMAHIRRSNGLDGGAAAALSGRPKMIAQAVQLISTVHYTHYMQVQAPRFLEPAVAPAPEVTKASVASVKAQLERGRLALVAMWNQSVVFGHVVLAYRVEAARDHDDVYVYDSNVQHGAERGETILRIGHDGRITTMKKAPGAAPAADPIYDGADWYSRRDALSLVHLADDAHEGANLRALADRLARTDLTTVYLTSVHGLLDSLTQGDPARTTLRDDVRTFLLEVQTVQQAAGDRTIRPSERITTTAGALEINRLLTAHTELTVKTVVPHALPAGIELSNTTLLLHGTDANLAYLDTTLTLRKGSPVKEVIRALGNSAMLAGQTALFEWLETAARLAGELAVSVRVKTFLRKRAMPTGFKTPYGLMPEVQGLHAAVGDVARADTPDHAFQIEIAKPVLQKSLELLLERTRALQQTGDVRVDNVSMDLEAGDGSRPGKLVLTARVRAFSPVLSANRGINWTVDPVSLSFQIYRYRSRNMAANRWYVHGRLGGTVSARDGVAGLAAGAVTDIVTAVFPALKSRLDAWISENLANALTFVEGLELKNLAVSTSALTADTGEALVDLEKLGQRAFGAPFPVEVKQVRILSDRIVLGGTPR